MAQPQPTRTLLASAGGTFVVTFDGAAVQMVMPALRRALHADITAVEWSMTAYLLVTTAAYLPAGRLGDNLGRARVWTGGLALFVLASLGCLLAPSLAWLIAARVLQALGAAAITASSAPLLLDAFPPRQRARALAGGSVAIGAGLLLGPTAGALLTRALSWRLLFAVAVPLGASVWLIGRGHLPPGRRRARAVDVGGALASAAGLAALVVGGSFAPRWGWRAPATLALVLGGAALLGGFVAVELRRAQPLVELRLFARRSFACGALASLLAYAALFAATVTLPFVLIELQHRSLVESGLLAGIVPLALAVAAPLGGLVADRAGARWVCSVGLAAVAAGLALATRLDGGGAATLVIALVLVGAGLGAFEPPNSAASLGALESADFGTGAATLGVARNLGLTIGSALAGTLLGGAAHAGSATAHAGAATAQAGSATAHVTAATAHAGAATAHVVAAAAPLTTAAARALAVGAACALAAALVAALRPSRAPSLR